MKLFIKFFLLLLTLQLNGNTDKVDINSLWELKVDIKVQGSFNKLNKTGICATYNYNIILLGTIGFDEDRDFVYYYKEGKIKDFELKYLNLKNNRKKVKKKKKIDSHIEFIIRNGRNVYLEFITEKMGFSKIDKNLNKHIKLPVSYGILNRKANRKYRKNIIKGSNKIFWRELLLYSKLYFKKKYNWVWEKKTNKLIQVHSVDINLQIKII